tara:strand:- start:329 stop:2341 length:2013 start_codon:yes stop_codon:yes gene_type:complete
MAKYYVDTDSSGLTIGAIAGVEEPAGQIRNVVLTNVDPDSGNWVGTIIEAKNFKIEGGNLASSSNETYVWNGLGSRWGVDVEINQVVFTNLGTIGTQDNKVNMAITFNAFTPTENANIDIDLEESDTDPIEVASHEFSLQINFGGMGYQTITTSTSYTKIVNSTSLHTFSGTILTDGSVVVATVQFEADPNFYYDEDTLNTISSGALGYFNLYSSEIVERVYTNYNLTGFKVRAFFNWNAFIESGGQLDLYLNGTYGPNQITITHSSLLQVATLPVGDRIHSVSYPPSLTSSQGEIPIRVFGSANAPYNLSVEKKTSTTSIVTASSNGYYNFSTRAFQTAATSLDSTCNAKGVNINHVLLPDVSSDTRYDITVSGVVAGSTTVLNSNVPQKAGDAIITKYGVDTITIKPIAYDLSKYGSLPANIAVSKEKLIPGQLSRSVSPTSVIVKGGTGGSSSTRLVLNTKPSGIFSGMVVTGSGVAHGSTVSAISKNIVTLSGLSTIANNTDIRFTANTANLKPFTFTVVPNASAHALSLTASADLNGSIGGLTIVKGKTNGANKNTVTFTLDSTKGIVPGMVVTGDAVNVDAGTDLTVASVTSSTVLVFSEIQELPDDALLRFSGGNASADTNLHSIQANEVGDNIVITGYVISNTLKATADVRVYIDDIITVTP